MLIKRFLVIWLFVITVSIFALFFIKHRVQILNTKLNTISNNIKQEKETIHILKAELAYLSNPLVIQEIANTKLNLLPIKREQITFLELEDN